MLISKVKHAAMFTLNLFNYDALLNTNDIFVVLIHFHLFRITSVSSRTRRGFFRGLAFAVSRWFSDLILSSSTFSVQRIIRDELIDG